MYLNDGSVIYPGYMDKNCRSELKQRIGDSKDSIRCGCRKDISLFYAISSDLKFYPVHKGYEHSMNCIRNNDARKQTGYVESDDGTVTAYLTFNPASFSVSVAEEDESEMVANVNMDELEEAAGNNIDNESAASAAKDKDNKDKSLNLRKLVRSINLDTFSERMILEKPILSKDYFTNALWGRLKNIYINGQKKSLRDYNLDNDNVVFFYAPVQSCSIEHNNAFLDLKGYNGKTLHYFCFSSTIKKAMKSFYDNYNLNLDDKQMKDHIYAAGFLYKCYSKKKQTHYTVVGRVHFFLVSSYGLYCRNIYEVSTFDTIMKYIKMHPHENIKFTIPTDEGYIDGVFELAGCNTTGYLSLYKRKYLSELIHQYEVKGLAAHFFSTNIKKVPMVSTDLDTFLYQIKHPSNS